MTFGRISIGLVFLTYAITALAQTFPDRPVRVVLPQIPGGTSDVLGRIVAQKLTEKWGHNVFIENRAGGVGTIGMDAVAKSAPNGYTWLLQHVGTHAVNPALFKKLPFDTIKDFTAVATLAVGPFVVVVSNESPARTLQDLIEFARRNPGRLNWGAQIGSINHLLGLLINSSAGISTVWVPYRGAADSLTDTISGQLQFNIGSAGAVAGLIKTGKIRGLATSGSKRVSAFPEVPTIAEAGFPDLTADTWWGILVPAGVSADVVQKINTDINAVLATPDVIARFQAVGAEPFPTTPAQFEKMVRDDIVKWGKAVSQAKLKQIE